MLCIRIVGGFSQNETYVSLAGWGTQNIMTSLFSHAHMQTQSLVVSKPSGEHKGKLQTIKAIE